MPNNNPGGDHPSQHPKSDEHKPHTTPTPGEHQHQDDSSRHGSDRGAGAGHKGRSSNPGNFANDPDRARKAGQKGGKA